MMDITQIIKMIENIEPEWCAIYVSFLLGLAGIFDIRSWFFKPILTISISVKPPDCHMIPLTNTRTYSVIDEVYYLRFRIKNEGNREARNVQVIVSELYRFTDREYRKVDSFLPLNLVWSHIGGLSMQTIPPGIFCHCDLGYLTHNEWKDHLLSLYPLDQQADVILKMDTIVEPNTGSHIIFPGKYLLTVHVSSDNTKTLKKLFKIEIRNVWSDLGEQMVSIEEA